MSDFQEYIKEKIKELGSQSAVARKTGLSQGAINALLHRPRMNPSSKTISLLKEAFGEEVEAFSGAEYHISKSDIEAIADAVVRKLGLAALQK